MSAMKSVTALSAIAGFAVLMYGWRDGDPASRPSAPSVLRHSLGGNVAAAAEPDSVSAAAEPTPSSAAASVPSSAFPRPPAAGSNAATPASGTPLQIDITALRYFAQQGDTRRLEIEIARLKALYPSWQPPENPLDLLTNAPQGDPELDRIWELYAQGKFAEVREAIGARQASQPGWQPPADLLERVGVAEARLQLVNASNLQQSESVIRIAAATPSLLTCSEVDVLWRVARAFAETKRPDRAKDAYLYVLRNCDNAGERLATVQMAVQRLSRADLEPLLATERTGPDGVGEFASVRTDLARADVAEAADDAALQVSDADLSLLRRLTEAPDGKASDSELLGWYALRRGDPAGALPDFEHARTREDSATISQGYALSLIPLGRFADAEGAMTPWRSASDGARAVYLAAAANLLAASAGQAIAPETLARIAQAVGEGQDAASAQQLGWYAFHLNQFPTAAQWFAAALRWQSDNEPAAYGLALVEQRLGDRASLATLQRTFGGRSPRIAAIGRPDQAQVAAAQAAREAGGAPAALAARPLPDAVAPPVASGALAPAPLAANPLLSGAHSAATAYAEPPMPAASRRRVAEAPPRPVPSTSPRRQTDTRGCRGAEIDPSTLSPEGAMARGWCLLGLDRSLEAAAAFESAARRGQGRTRQDASYGESLAYLRLGVGDRAAIAAARSPQPTTRRIELDTAILSARATGAFERKRPVETLQALDERARIAPERLDLMVLRGYAYLELRRWADARRVFSAVARTGNREGVRGLAALDQAQGRFPTGG